MYLNIIFIGYGIDNLYLYDNIIKSLEFIKYHIDTILLEKLVGNIKNQYNFGLNLHYKSTIYLYNRKIFN